MRRYQVWEHYDTDGNGFIEGEELDDFLREFISSVHPDQEEVHSLFSLAFMLPWKKLNRLFSSSRP